jgi:exopolysaccharide biosynthesis protein
MKKTFKTLSLTLLMMTLVIFSIPKVSAADSEVTTGTYDFLENKETNDLSYGVTHYRDYGNTTSTLDAGAAFHQQVNVLEVPTDIATKVVVWGKQVSNGWTRATVTSFAQDFELKNPGWVVLAAVNGDFFDISANGDLPYQTIGAMVQDGEVVRSLSGNMPIGFTNDGSANSLIGAMNFQASGLKLAVYDKNDNIINTFDVAKVNQEPAAGEISVYYAIQDKIGATWSVTKALLPDTAANEYIVEYATKALPMSSTHFYGIGTINLTDTQKELAMGQFGISSNNAEANQLMATGVKIRVQRDVIGDYANATSITGVNYRMLYNGSENVISGDDNATTRHPRTMVGKKADGTLMFFTVDGRQPGAVMNGAFSGEMAAIMKYYGCVDGYNLDGGGSTTMVVRDGVNFRVVNSPSEGNQRSDSNAILVVAPELKIKADKVSDTTATFSYPTNLKKISVSDVKVTVNGVTKEMVGNTVTFDNLSSKTTYDVEYTYKLSREGFSKDMTGISQKVTTGKQMPSLTNLTCKLEGNYYVFTYELIDPDACVTFLSVNFDDGVEYPSKNETTYKLSKSKVTGDPDFTIEVNYNLVSSLPEATKFSQTVQAEIPETPEEPPVQPSTGCNYASITLFNQILGLSVIAASAFIYLRSREER